LKSAGILRGPLFTTFYGYDVTRYVRQNGPRVYRALFAYADRILCLGRKMRDELIELQCDERKLEVHHLGVDLSRFGFSPRKPKNNGAVEIVTPARLVEKKGLEYAIRAVAKLVAKYPLVQYRIAGDGPLRNHLQHVIDSLKLNSRIHLLGWQTQEQVVELLRNADILLAPSVTAADGDQEGTPTVLIEALAQGLPVITTEHSGIPEIVRDGESGFLVPERDIEALFERTSHLIDHPDLWEVLGRAGRLHVEKHFDINVLNDRLIDLYHDSILAHSTRPDGRSPSAN
jgi:colanic acid/amylovoran biosynthesis glycosyltransferase